MHTKKTKQVSKLHHFIVILFGSIILVLASFLVVSAFPKKLIAPQPTEPIEETNSENLLNTTWIWQETKLSNDQISLPSKPEAFTLTLTSDRAELRTDCNNGSGEYKLETETNSLKISSILQTLMYCEGSQESVFFEQLSEIDTYMLDGNTLYLFLPMDSGTMRFVRYND